MLLSRANFVLAVLMLVTLALGAKVVMLHTFDGDFLLDQGDARTIRMERINAHRGMIQDRHGKPLAVSSPVLSIWGNPSEILTEPEKMEELAGALGIETGLFKARMEGYGNRGFVYLRRKLSPSEAAKITDLGVPGIHAEREYNRFYPSGEVTAHIVGFTDIDDLGQEGVELVYNEWLGGTPGKKKVIKNLYGRIIKDVMPVQEMKSGRDLNLSIDLRIQYLAYRELKTAVQYYEALSGSIVVLDVASGEILAMVNQPSFNPNNRKQLDIAAVRNRAVTDVFEPGSTVKPITVAVALQSGAYLPSSEIDTSPGFVRIDGATIRDPSNQGVLTMSQIVALSSQVGISKLALSLNEYDVWELFHDVGFGRATGIGFPGEREGTLPNYRRWKDIERATFAYGYGLSVTPLQLAGAYLTIASGGIKRELSLITQNPDEGTRVMDEDVAHSIQAMLHEVVKNGTGKKAATDAYTVGGKTGTVRKIGESGYLDTQHLAFFAGMAPVSSPRVVAVVLINEPGSEAYGGGAVAAPVFSRVISGALRLMNVPPDKVKGAA